MGYRSGIQKILSTQKNSVLGSVTGIKIPAGASVLVFTGVSLENVSQIYAYALTKNNEAHNFTIKLEHKNKHTEGYYAHIKSATSATSNGGLRVVIEQTPVVSQYCDVALTNSDVVDRYYIVVLGGIR